MRLGYDYAVFVSGGSRVLASGRVDMPHKHSLKGMLTGASGPVPVTQRSSHVVDCQSALGGLLMTGHGWRLSEMVRWRVPRVQEAVPP